MGTRPQPMEDLWRDKTNEVDNYFEFQVLSERLEKEGVHRPVIIIPPSSPHYRTSTEEYTMGQGHHRVAASKQLEDKEQRERYIPVIYDWDFNHLHSD